MTNPYDTWSLAHLKQERDSAASNLHMALRQLDASTYGKDRYRALAEGYAQRVDTFNNLIAQKIAEQEKR